MNATINDVKYAVVRVFSLICCICDHVYLRIIVLYIMFLLLSALRINDLCLPLFLLSVPVSVFVSACMDVIFECMCLFLHVCA